jgi:hypothetical protein
MNKLGERIKTCISRRKVSTALRRETNFFDTTRTMKMVAVKSLETSIAFTDEHGVTSQKPQLYILQLYTHCKPICIVFDTEILEQFSSGKCDQHF